MRSLNKYIEECGEVSTPSNTMGMGDVMLPDGVNLGVDGIPQKKNKKKKKISESVFDEDDNMNDIDKNSLLYGFLNCLLKTIDKCDKRFGKYSIGDVMKYVKQYDVVTVDKSTIIINYENLRKAPNPKDKNEEIGMIGAADLLSLNSLKLSTEFLPKLLKKIIFTNNVVISLYGNDLSDVDIECNGIISIRCQSKGDIAFGKISCNFLDISDSSYNQRDIKSISFKQDSNINTLDIMECYGLEDLKGNALDIKNINMEDYFIRNYLVKHKIIKQIPNISIRTHRR